MPSPHGLPFRLALVPALLIAGSPISAAEHADAKKPAEIRLQTQPEGAEVRLGDRAAGKTPVVLKGVKPGPHTLTLSKDGFLPVTLRIEVTGGANLGTVHLAKKDARITVWRVAPSTDPRFPAVPAAEAPARLESLVKAAGFRLRVAAYSAEDFPKAFRKAASEQGGAGLPDVVAVIDYGPIRE